MDEENQNKYLEEVTELINSRQPDIFKNYPEIRDIFRNGYEGDTEMNPLRNEIGICIIFGLYQAALTLTNHMIEKYLKIALIYKNADFSAQGESSIDKIVNTTAQSTGAYNSNDMDKNINAACRQGIITKDDKKMLHRFRENFRNAYSHADASKIHKDVAVPLVGAQVGEDGFQVEQSQDALVAMLPMLQGILQTKHAEANALPYFQYVDSLIRRTRKNIYPEIKVPS